MRITIVVVAFFTLFACLLTVCIRAQQLKKPSITSIRAMPGEPIPKGTCSYATSGYLEMDGSREFTDADLGKLIAPALRQGYVITLYPPIPGHGIYAFQDCPAAQKPKATDAP